MENPDSSQNADASEHDSAFVALLTEHQLPLRLYVQSLLPGDPSAQDVSQQANATVWKKRSDFELGTNFKAWAFSIARYEVLNYRKQQARDSRLTFSEELEEIFASELPEHTDGLALKQEALGACLGKLKGKDRDLILHRYYQGEPLQQFADKVGRSVGGLKVTLHRLRENLQRCIESQLKREEVAS